MRIAPLIVDSSANGRRALVGLPYRRATLIELASGRTRRLPRHLQDASLSPAVHQTAAIRHRGDGCDLVVLTSGHTRSLRPIPCLSVISWDGPRIGLLSAGRRRQRVSLVAAGDDHHPLEAWLIPPGGRRLVRPLPQLERVGASDEFVFTPDDRAVVIQESGGTLARIALADGAREPLPIKTDGPFDAL